VQKTAAAGKVCQRSKSVNAKTKKEKRNKSKKRNRNSDHLSQFSMSFH
jgi:hypothetical protein